MKLEKNPAARFVVRTLAYSLIGWFFLTFNPFGISEKTDQATQDAIYKVSAPYYQSDSQKDVIVVLLNGFAIGELYDRDAIEANEWPIRYRDHAYLLSRIIKYDPRAIFVDVYFKQERSTDDSFRQFSRRIDQLSERHQTPLLFAGGYQGERQTVIQRKLGKVGELVVNGWEGYGRAYPLNDNGRTTAAYRLYQLACLEGSPLASCSPPLVDDATVDAGDAMSVLWGNQPAPVVFPEFMEFTCSDRSRSIMEVGRQMVLGFINGLVDYGSKGTPVNAQCSYHSVIYADELVYVDKSGTDEQRERLANAFKDKVVMYGLSLEGLHDRVFSPVHGQLPGVFFHAMALDNLMHYGDEYIRVADERMMRISQFIWIAITLIFSAILFYYERRGICFSATDACYSESPGTVRHISAFRLFAAAFSLIITISILLFWLMRYEPLNSVGFLILIGVSSWLVHSDFAERLLKIPGAISRFPGWVSRISDRCRKKK